MAARSPSAAQVKRQMARRCARADGRPANSTTDRDVQRYESPRDLGHGQWSSTDYRSAMQPAQWFTLWMTLIATVGGGIVTLVGVTLAFRFNVINTIRQDQRERERESLTRLHTQLADAHKSLEVLLSLPMVSEGIPLLAPAALELVSNAVSSLPENGESVAASVARPIRVAIRDVEVGQESAGLRSLADLIGKQRQIIEDKLGAPLPAKWRRGL